MTTKILNDQTSHHRKQSCRALCGGAMCSQQGAGPCAGSRPFEEKNRVRTSPEEAPPLSLYYCTGISRRPLFRPESKLGSRIFAPVLLPKAHSTYRRLKGRRPIPGWSPLNRGWARFGVRQIIWIARYVSWPHFSSNWVLHHDCRNQC